MGRTGRLSLLDEALTHATFCTSTPLPCYQRLEFLGDAALDLLLMTHHYVRDRSVSPGYLSEMRSVAVNNERLAQVAVELGCAHQLRHGSQTLHRDVTQYTKVRCLGCLQTADASPTPANLYPSAQWRELTRVNSPSTPQTMLKISSGATTQPPPVLSTEENGEARPTKRLKVDSSLPVVERPPMLSRNAAEEDKDSPEYNPYGTYPNPTLTPTLSPTLNGKPTYSCTNQHSTPPTSQCLLVH